MKKFQESTKHSPNRSALSLLLLAILVLAPHLAAALVENAAGEKEIHISVLADKSLEQSMAKWGPTADYLTEHIPGYRFKMFPYRWTEIHEEVAAGQSDFVLCNPGMYVEFEVQSRFRRIATVMNLRLGKAYTEFGALLFTRADRSDIKTVHDLKGKHLAAVNETAFGGWQVSWKTLLDLGFDPYKKLEKLSFTDSHDNVIIQVRDGKADAGGVRTDALEGLAAKGTIRLEDFKPLYLNQDSSKDFPFLISSRLYPEWPFSASPQVPSSLVRKVAMTLLQIPPDSKAAIAGNYAGWTVPSNYESVDDVLKQLRVPPYTNYGKFTLKDVLKKYWTLAATTFIFMLILLERSLTIRRKNHALKATLDEVEKAKGLAEEANLKIMDSLHYSQRIQRSLLPTVTSLGEWLPEHFVVWLPRDLVSGDLYFAASVKTGSIAAVVDCTGHGVPGALMTMIAYSCLRTIILGDEAGNDPALILRRLNNMIRTSLHKDMEETISDDGMDAAVCFLQSDHRRLLVAGARMPVFLVESDGKLTVIKGDRQSVGYKKSDPDFAFAGKEVEITTRTMVYLVSDGYLDQLGGKQGLPFGTKRFCALLQQIHQLPVAAQRELLLSTLSEYSGDRPQMDDTTIFCFACLPS